MARPWFVRIRSIRETNGRATKALQRMEMDITSYCYQMQRVPTRLPSSIEYKQKLLQPTLEEQILTNIWGRNG
eukprot:6461265-Amphidinium_carterae.1